MPSEHALTLTPASHGLPDGWTPERFQRELEQAAASFTQPAVPCSSLALTVTSPEPRRIAAEDGTSLIGFRSDQWCHNSRCGHLDTFPHNAMAMTETHPAGTRGAAIAEADIELNAVHFRFTDAAAKIDPAEREVPLRAVLLHELGHAVGLEDRCVPEGGRHGAHSGIPDEDLCARGEAESVMFAPGLNLALSPLDVAALCAVHPAAGAPSNVSAAVSLAPNTTDFAALPPSSWLPLAFGLAFVAGLLRGKRPTRLLQKIFPGAPGGRKE
jgi:hypothetical protein